MRTQSSLNQYTNKLSVYFVGDYDVQKKPPLILTMSLTKTIQSTHPISFKNWLLHYPPKSPKWFFLFRFSKQTLYTFFSTICMLHIDLYYLPCYDYVNNIWWWVTDMKLTTESFASLHTHLPLTSNILLTTLLSQTLNMGFSRDVKHQISHPHNMTGTISVL